MPLWGCVAVLGFLIVFEENMSSTCVCYVDIICVYVSERTFKVVPVVLASLAVAAYHLAFLHFCTSSFLRFCLQSPVFLQQ